MPSALASAIQSGAGPRVSAVMASLSEGDNLVATCASIKHDLPGAELIVADDASPTPEPIRTVRNLKRLGVSGARAVGCRLAQGDVIAVFDAHSALDSESAQWFNTRWARGAVWPSIREDLDRTPHKLSVLAACALERNALVYCGTGTQAGCGMYLNPDGVWGGKWQGRRRDLPPVDAWETSCCMGSVKVLPRTLLDLFGGWPQLLGLYGKDEEALSLLAIAHGIPILTVQSVTIYHLFRGFGKTEVPVPYDMPVDRAHHPCTAAMYRLVFDDAHWQGIRAMLRDGAHIPEATLRSVETNLDWNRYRGRVQDRFKRSSAEIFEELHRRMDREKSEREPWLPEDNAP